MRSSFLLVTLALAAPATAESYGATVESALSHDRALGLVHTWTATCTAEEPSTDAALSAPSHDLRFAAAPEQPLEAGVDATLYSIEEGSAGRYVYEAVPGARVIGRVVVRCGTAEVFDQIVVDTAPVVVPPALSPPTRLVDADTLSDVPGGSLRAGTVVELAGLVVEASPRGSEEIELVFAGAGVDAIVTLGPADFVEQRATLSPQVAPSEPGELTIEARLLGASSELLSFTVLASDDREDTEDDPPSDGAAAGCAASAPGASGFVPLAVAIGGCRRRRQR